MQRFWSIATAAALLFSLISPNMMAMANCAAASNAPSCHPAEAKAPHCDRAMHHHHESTPPGAGSSGTGGSGLFALNSGGKCPMDCCTPGHPQSGTAMAGNSILPLPAVGAQSFSRVVISFISPGFSSHTDRGPPLV